MAASRSTMYGSTEFPAPGLNLRTVKTEYGAYRYSNLFGTSEFSTRWGVFDTVVIISFTTTINVNSEENREAVDAVEPLCTPLTDTREMEHRFYFEAQFSI